MKRTEHTMDVSCKRVACVVLITVLVLLTADALQGRAEIGVARRGDRPTSREQRQEAQRGVPHAVIQFHEGFLSVRIRNAPWDDVLHAIERQVGIMIQVKGQLAGTVSLEFEALPLEQGLRRLFHDANVLFFYATGIQGSPTLERLIRVVLFAKAGEMTEAEALHRPSLEGAAAGEREEPGSTALTADASASQAAAEPEHEAGLEDDEDERLTALQRFAEQDNIEALQRAIFAPDQTIQAKALELLGERDRQVLIDALVDATKSDQPAVQLRALSLLHQTDQADHRTVLSALELALLDQDVTVKSFAIQALAERGGADAMGALRQALHDRDVTIRKMVIEGAAQTEQGRSLLQEALSDDDASVRSLAAFWLEEAAAHDR